MSPFCYFAYNPGLVNKPPILGYQPLHRNLWNRINGGFVNVRKTPRGLMNIVASGHPYTASHKNYRHERNFIMGQTLSLDFDTEDSRSRLTSLANDPFIAANATFLYTTPSHTDATPRGRAVFVLEEAVRSPQVYSLAARALVRLYEQSDQSCKDPARIFFGSKDCETVWLGNRMPLDVLHGMMADVRDEDSAQAQAARERVILDISDKTLYEHVDESLNHIRNAPDGERHSTRLRISKLMGGYVSAGYLSFSEAAEYLVGAAMENTSSPESEIWRDVNSGLQSGLSLPVSLTPRRFADYGLFLPE